LRKKQIGTQHDRKLRKYSEGFNKVFNFFLNSHRRGILCFSGSEDFKVIKDESGEEGKFCFRLFEDGRCEKENDQVVLKTRHPNLVYGVIKGKKSWGLWKDQWTDGIVDGSFSRDEILSEFKKWDIEIPESFLKEFDNLLDKKKKEKYSKEIERLNSGGMWK